MSRPDFDALIEAVGDLPALPESTLRIVKATASSDSDARTITAIIGSDQALAARILRLANSAFYGLPRTIATISHAVVLLGMNTIRGLALAASTRSFLERECPGYALARGELWRHSLAVAACSRIIAKQVRIPEREETFVAGLLHDVGKVVIGTHVGREFGRIMGLASTENMPFVEAERQVLGFDHTDVGAAVAHKWNLPGQLRDPIAFHHRPEEAPELTPGIAAVHLADIIAMTFGIGVGGDGLMYHPSPAALPCLQLTKEEMELLMADMAEVLSSDRAAKDLDEEIALAS